MSEIRRVVLNSFEPQKTSAKVVKKSSKTTRISVVLPPSTEDICPEYNYKEELAAVKKKTKESKGSNGVANGLDPFGDEDDDVKKIAMEMEAKYGTAVTAKKKKKGRKDDYADIGMGYDESDSFIDNTDGYDEIIPANVTTLCGGFYINSGALVFKTDDEATSDYSSSSSDNETEEKKRKKRVLDTTDEEDEDDEEKQKEKKPKLSTPQKNSMQQAIKKKLFSPNKIQVKKRRLIDPMKKTVKDLLREKRKDDSPPVLVPENIKENGEKESTKENKKPMSMESVTDAIEAVVKESGKDISIEEKSTQNENKGIASVKLDNPSTASETSQDSTKNDKVEIVKLPEGLPANVLDVINNLKKAALDYKDAGKVKFFTDEVNAILLSLERNCKCLGKSSRVKVYEHLAPFIKCKKETLMRRAKNLVLEDEVKKLKSLLMMLKAQINQAMPTLLSNYERDCIRISQMKQDNPVSEETKAIRMPKRKFYCSEDIKKLIRDIWSIKKRCLILEGKSKETLEDQLFEFLKSEVQVLWPEGWMSAMSLRKTVNVLKTPQKPITNNVPKHSQLSMPNSGLTIFPINTTNKEQPKSELTVNKSSDTSSQKQPFDKINITKSVNPIESKIKLPKESGVIVINSTKSENIVKSKTDSDPVIPEVPHCQIIDLTKSIEKNHHKSCYEEPRPFKSSNEPDTLIRAKHKDIPAKVLKYPELSIQANPHDGDDIQKVMENLKALQKLSSPKPETSSSVSVIAVNKTYSPKSGMSPTSSSTTSCDYNTKSDFSKGFSPEDYQRQFLSSLNSQLSTSSLSSKSSFNQCS